jgi:hypothetical protein
MSESDAHPRPRGILTPTDREFLRGDTEDYSKQQKRDRRRKIRERVYHALLDFALLWMFLEPRDVALIFDAPEDAIDTTLRKAVQDMVAFAVLGMVTIGDNRPLRIGAGLLQAATAAGGFPLEFTLRYPESYSEQVRWNKTASEADDTVQRDAADVDSDDALIDELFPESDWISSRFAVSTPSHKQEMGGFTELNYLAREHVLLGDDETELEDIAETIETSLDDPDAESVSSLVERLKMERQLVEQLRPERHVFSYPMAIDSETGDIIWAGDLEEYPWYEDHILK